MSRIAMLAGLLLLGFGARRKVARQRRQRPAIKAGALAAAVLLVPSLAGPAHAALVTYNFSGAFLDSSPLFSVGDRFSGSYTFESTSAELPHPDSTLEIQSRAIQPAFSGTGWSVHIQSSATAPFTMTGTGAWISVGNDKQPAGIDRYVVTFDSPAAPIPSGSFAAFQIDLFDFDELMLSADGISATPTLAFADNAGGRFIVNGFANACQFCNFRLDTLSPVPEPETYALLLAGLGLLGFAAVRRKA
jgi:PEP-CTERM motif